MKVSELIELLSKLPKDADVMVDSRDFWEYIDIEDVKKGEDTVILVIEVPMQ